jgi:hypothetical protein
MKTFKEWLSGRVFESGDYRLAGAAAGALLGGPLGAAIGYGLGGAGRSSPNPSQNSGGSSSRVPRKHENAKKDQDELRRTGVIEGEVTEDKVDSHGDRWITYKLPNGVTMTKSLGNVNYGKYR